MPQPVFVGVDAPLIIANETGRRPCERVLSRAFASREAGPHPVNLSMPHFRDGGRAMRLCRRLGLQAGLEDPRATAGVMAEVYPHPSIVCLFGLDVTLKYKARKGRTLDSRRAELLVLCDSIEGLERRDVPLRTSSSTRWGELVTMVRDAPSMAALRVPEDEIDAYVCAYTVLLHDRAGGADTLDVGDRRSGSILLVVDERAREDIARARATLLEQGSIPTVT